MILFHQLPTKLLNPMLGHFCGIFLLNPRSYLTFWLRTQVNRRERLPAKWWVVCFSREFTFVSSSGSSKGSGGGGGRKDSAACLDGGSKLKVLVACIRRLLVPDDPTGPQFPTWSAHINTGAILMGRRVWPTAGPSHRKVCVILCFHHLALAELQHNCRGW